MTMESAIHDGVEAQKSDLVDSDAALKATSSVHDPREEKPPFGSRFLTEEADVWSKNAWDHVPPPQDQAEKIAQSLSRQQNTPVPEADKVKYNVNPSRHWDSFYKMYSNNFFKNRKWLHTEFPELVKTTQPGAGPVTIAEIGCGAGNSVFPLLASNENQELNLKAFDYSTHAVKLVQNNPLYASPSCGSITAAVWDLTSKDGLPHNVAEGSVDIIILVFVLSALHPDEWAQAVANIYKMLKPGGLVVMRDYGRYDLTQLRFKEGRLLDENFYIRGDKTRVYFFELDDLALLFSGSPAPSFATVTESVSADNEDGEEPHTNSPDPTIATPGSSESIPLNTYTITAIQSSEGDAHSVVHPKRPRSQLVPGCPPHPLFSVEQLGVDRRLLVNRKRQLKMYRVWMQGKFKKK